MKNEDISSNAKADDGADLPSLARTCKRCRRVSYMGAADHCWRCADELERAPQARPLAAGLGTYAGSVTPPGGGAEPAQPPPPLGSGRMALARFERWLEKARSYGRGFGVESAYVAGYQQRGADERYRELEPAEDELTAYDLLVRAARSVLAVAGDGAMGEAFEECEADCPCVLCDLRGALRWSHEGNGRPVDWCTVAIRLRDVARMYRADAESKTDRLVVCSDQRKKAEEWARAASVKNERLLARNVSLNEWAQNRVREGKERYASATEALRQQEARAAELARQLQHGGPSLWIRCADALPVPRSCVLVFCGDSLDESFHVVHCVLWNDGSGPQRKWVPVGDLSYAEGIQGVTHWMAMSVPPDYVEGS